MQRIMLVILVASGLAFTGCTGSFTVFDGPETLEKNKVVFAGKVKLPKNYEGATVHIITGNHMPKNTEVGDRERYGWLNVGSDYSFFLVADPKPLYMYTAQISWTRGNVHYIRRMPLQLKFNLQKFKNKAVYIGTIILKYNSGEDMYELDLKDEYNKTNKEFIEYYGKKMKLKKTKGVFLKKMPIPDFYN